MTAGGIASTLHSDVCCLRSADAPFLRGIDHHIKISAVNYVFASKLFCGYLMLPCTLQCCNDRHFVLNEK